LAMRSVTAATHSGVMFVVRLISQGSAPPHSSSLSVAAVEESTRTTIGAL
jgi:hypothetical protein